MVSHPDSEHVSGMDTNPPWPRPAYSWYVVAILLLAYTLSFIDRMILSLLVAPIRAALDISDTQVSLLIGLAFALFYTVLGLPLAWIADRRVRTCGELCDLISRSYGCRCRGSDLVSRSIFYAQRLFSAP